MSEISYKDNKYGGKYKTEGKPATIMIKKVAEAQGLHMASDIFQGTYSEYKSIQMENNNGRVIQGDLLNRKT